MSPSLFILPHFENALCYTGVNLKVIIPFASYMTSQSCSWSQEFEKTVAPKTCNNIRHGDSLRLAP